MLDLHVLQLGEGPAERLLRPLEDVTVVVVAGVGAIGAEGSVAAAPEDAPVHGGAEVVEEGAPVLHALASLPAHALPLLLGEGFGEQDVRVEGQDVLGELRQTGAVTVGGQDRPIGADSALGRAGYDLHAVLRQLLQRRPLEDLGAQADRRVLQAAHQSGRVDQGAVGLPQGAAKGGRMDHCLHLVSL